MDSNSRPAKAISRHQAESEAMTSWRRNTVGVQEARKPAGHDLDRG